MISLGQVTTSMVSWR